MFQTLAMQVNKYLREKVENEDELPIDSWPAEGRPRPKVPNLGGAYMLQKI